MLLMCDVFRADLLRSDNLSGTSSLEKTDSPSLSSAWLPVVLRLRVELSEICLPALVLSFCRSCLWPVEQSHSTRYFACVHLSLSIKAKLACAF